MTFSAVIFDMDGLLVDSEPIWHEVERDLIEAQGYTYALDVRNSTIGLQVHEFAHIIYKHYPKVADSSEGVAQAIVKGMTSVPREKVKAQPGADAIIRYVAEQNIPRAIASSSVQAIIEHFVEIMGWADLIPRRFSTEFVNRGKPAPDIYLYTTEQLGIPPEKCLALEDSPAGTQAAIAAGMTCYTVPDLSHCKISDFDGINDNIYDSLFDVLDEFKTKALLS